MSLNVIYPNHDGARFDTTYYRATHIPLAMKVMKADNVILIEGVPMGDAAPPYAMIAHFQFASPEAMKAALANPAMAEVRADVAKFTDIKPTIMLGKSLSGARPRRSGAGMRNVRDDTAMRDDLTSRRISARPRRFCARPSRVLFGATGCLSPKLTTLMLSAGIPNCSIRYRFTVSARAEPSSIVVGLTADTIGVSRDSQGKSRPG